jgi:NAD(P)-dependent dehydrogenase (short-subunit alcohol dehydrogenase family)
MQARGLTLERVYHALETTALQPLFTLPALAYLYRQPEHFASLLVRIFGTAPPFSSRAVTKSLQVLTVLGIAVRLNRYLNRKAANNWTVAKTFDATKDIVVVTGASQGLGLCIAKSFAARGVKVAALDLSEPKSPLPENITFYQVDLVDWEAVNRVADRVRSDIGDPTVVINNAGISSPRLLLPQDAQQSPAAAANRIAQFQRVIEVNLTTHLRTSLAFVPAMIANNHGHIISISSMLAYAGSSPSCEYSMSKVAVQAFHEVLAMELKHTHKAPMVRTTSYFPVWLRTPMAESRLSRGPPLPNYMVREPEDLAEEIVAQVFSGESGGQVVNPGRLNALTGIRGFPLWLQIFIKEAFFLSGVPKHA